MVNDDLSRDFENALQSRIMSDCCERDYCDAAARANGLERLVRFMADRLDAVGFREYGPASWGYIVREARALGVELER